MSYERFIELLQQILTMVDPADKEQVKYAKEVLKNLRDLAIASDKADGGVLRAMTIAYHEFEFILPHRNEFAGTPGDITGNRIKRQRLAMMVRPTC